MLFCLPVGTASIEALRKASTASLARAALPSSEPAGALLIGAGLAAIGLRVYRRQLRVCD